MVTMLMFVKSSLVVLMIVDSVKTQEVACYQPKNSPCSKHTTDCNSFDGLPPGLEEYRIGIEYLNYYSNPKFPTCQYTLTLDECDTHPCCAINSGDTKESFSREDSLAVYKTCAFEPSCTVTSPYNRNTGYRYVEYGFVCIHKTDTYDMIKTGTLSIRGWLALYFRGKDSPVKGLTCSCDLTAKLYITIQYIYLSGESCAGLTITGDDKPLYTCDDDGAFIAFQRNNKIKKRYKILFNNMTSSYDDVIWIEFSGRGKTLTASCDCDKAVIDGAWSNWSEFSVCSVSCGRGVKTRTRVCDYPAPANGGANCLGVSTQIVECNQLQECTEMGGGWGSWSKYSACSVSCGGGSRTRTMKCDRPTPTGKTNCPVVITQIKECNQLKECPVAYGNILMWSIISVGVVIIILFFIIWLVRRKRNTNTFKSDPNRPTVVDENTRRQVVREQCGQREVEEPVPYLTVF